MENVKEITFSNSLIGKELKRLRKERSLRQSDLAEKTGLTSQAIIQIEKDRVSPTAATRRTLARALELPADYFLEPKANVKPAPTHQRLVVEIDLPKDTDFSERDIGRIRRAMLDAGRHIINVLKDIDTKA